MGLGQGGLQVVQKARIVAGQRARAGNENIVMAREPIKGKKRLRRSPKPPFGPVALDRAADLAGGGETGPPIGLAVGAKLKGDGAADLANAFLGAQEIGSFLQPIQRLNG
jgi:hypothetical protein